MDQRNQVLAKNLVNNSVKVKKGEKVLIECRGTSGIELANLIVREVYKVGGFPFISVIPESTERELSMCMTEEHANNLTKYENQRMDDMDCYIAVRGTSNISEFSDVPSANMEAYQKFYSKPIHSDRRIPNTRWCVLRYPNASMAQAANTSVEAFTDFYYDVCCLDYNKMHEAMKPLVALMNKTDKVRLTAKDTDLSFSIKDIPAIACYGDINIPDGEVYTAPVRDSVNGVITYNTPSPNDGFVYENIQLTFENGKIVKATSNDTVRINEVFDADEGARYVGEFAIGVNPYIVKPMNDILFDEKITGSIHFTPGSSYDDAFNGNKSSLHWDLVLLQTEEYGGGEIYFDDVLIRKNGVFVHPDLLCLNPENLK